MQLNTLNMEKRTWSMLKIDGEAELKKRALKIEQLSRENEGLKSRLKDEGKENVSVNFKTRYSSKRTVNRQQEEAHECNQQ